MQETGRDIRQETGRDKGKRQGETKTKTGRKREKKWENWEVKVYYRQRQNRMRKQEVICFPYNINSLVALPWNAKKNGVFLSKPFDWNNIEIVTFIASEATCPNRKYQYSIQCNRCNNMALIMSTFVFSLNAWSIEAKTKTVL